jgi:hypothetical protein
MKIGGFILIIIGTLGLLFNEFVIEWSRVATLIFAALNLLGLAILVIATRIRGLRKAQTLPKHTIPKTHY